MRPALVHGRRRRRPNESARESRGIPAQSPRGESRPEANAGASVPARSDDEVGPLPVDRRGAVMSTKNLARTVIEGGRSHHNCWLRRYSNAQARSGERNLEASLRYETDFEGVVVPARQ